MKHNFNFKKYFIQILDTNKRYIKMVIAQYLFINTNQLLKCNKYDEAIIQFKKCLNIEQNNFEALLGLGKSKEYQKLKLQKQLG